MSAPTLRPILYEHFRSTANMLYARYEHSRNLGASANLGQVRELFTRDFLSGHLPPKLHVKSGEILDSVGNRTGQLDVVIVRDDTPTLAYAEGINCYIGEGVFAVIEVKSTLDRSELRRAVSGMQNVRNLQLSIQQIGITIGNESETRPLGPYRLVFAFESASWDTLIDELRASNGGDVFDMIVVLNRGILIRNWGIMKTDSDGHFNQASGRAAALAWPYYLLTTQATAFIGRSIDLAPYFRPESGWND